MEEKTLPEEHYHVYPLADPKCRLCRFPLEDLQKLHHLKFVEGYTFKQLWDYISANYNVNDSMTVLVTHFNKHTSEGKQLKLAEKLNIKVAAELENLSVDKSENNANNLQSAFDYLTQTCLELSESSSKIITPYLEALQSSLSDEKIKEKLDKKDPLKALEQMARVQKLIGEHVQNVAAMRAPKIVVAQFLDIALNEVIRQTGFLLGETFQMIEVEVTAELEAMGIKDVGVRVFKRVWIKAVEAWKKSMMDMKREQMDRALTTLSEIEKIV